MRPNNTIVAEVESTFEGENVQMGFDEEAMTHLMGILSEIYTDPVEAVAREYMTNAIDSHIEAGQTRPVEITTPNYFNPNYIIQDFGIGMDIDDIRRTYSKYGASTKRGSDAVNGMLGIGSKSAFAYSNNFTVVGVKDGRSVTVSVSRNAEGVGTMTILDESETTLPNGVTITVPVSEPQRMVDAVKRVTRVLPKGLVLVNGTEPSARDEWDLVASNVIHDGVLIENIFRVKNSIADRIIMGNVAYEPTASIRSTAVRSLNSGFYAEVAMGSVVFAPSREKLMDVARTQRAQQAVSAVIDKYLRDSLIKEIQAVDSPWDAVVKFSADSSILTHLGARNVNYKGRTIPTLTSNIYASKDDTLALRIYYMHNSRDKVRPASYINYQMIQSSLMVVTGAPDKSLSVTMRKKIDQYVSKNSITSTTSPNVYSSYRYAIMVIPERVDITGDYWLQGIDFVDWKDIEKEVLPRAERSSSGDGIKTAGKHFVLNEKGGFDLTVVDFKQKILYITATNVRKSWPLNQFASTEGGLYYGYTEGDLYKVMRRIYPALPKDIILVNVYANRIEKFLREYPNATELTSDAARSMLEKHVRDSTTDDEIRGWAIHRFFSGGADTYRYVPLADPDRAIIIPGPGVSAAYDKVEQSEALLRKDKAFADKMDDVTEEMSKVAERVKARYPLIGISNYGRRLDPKAMQRYYEMDYQHYLDSKKKEKK